MRTQMWTTLGWPHHCTRFGSIKLI